MTVDEDEESAGDQENGKRHQGSPCRIWLERAFPGKLVSTDALRFAAVVEAEVYNFNVDPVHKRGRRDKSLHPTKDDGRRGRERQIAQHHERSHRGHRQPRSAEAVGTLEDAGRMSLESKAIEGSRPHEHGYKDACKSFPPVAISRSSRGTYQSWQHSRHLSRPRR